MPGHKKKFPCGHSGHGRYCHRCRADEDKRRREDEDRRRERSLKNDRRSRFSSAPVDVSDLPPKVAEKVLEVIADQQKPLPQRRYVGKRFITIGQRHILRFEIGWSYRLIGRETNGTLEFLEVITHETYNSRIASGGWD